MNLFEDAVKIVCFGDSNTWGRTDDRSGQYPAQKRWTGVMQSALGENYTVLEEGLPGRTIASDDPRSEGRNGMTYAGPCVASHITITISIGI